MKLKLIQREENVELNYGLEKYVKKREGNANDAVDCVNSAITDDIVKCIRKL